MRSMAASGESSMNNDRASVRENPLAAVARWIRVEGSWVLMIFIASRLFVSAIILWSRMTMHRGRFWQPGGLLAVLTQYDSAGYLALVKKGYGSAEVACAGTLYPMFPMLAKLPAAFTRDVPLATTLTSNLCLLGAGLLLNELVRTDFVEVRVRRAAVLFLMFSPASVFLSSAYPESTFLMLSLVSLLAATRRQWLLASLFGMAASATRPIGVLLLVPLLIEYLYQGGRDRWSIRAVLTRRAFFLALVPCGAGLFKLYCYFRFHQSLFAWHGSVSMNPMITSPQNVLAYARDYDSRYGSLFVGFLAVSVMLLLAGGLLKVRSPHILYGLLLVAAFVCFARLDATPRNLGVVFPLFIAMGVIAAHFTWSYEGMLALSVGLLTLWTVLFANGQYVA